MNAGTDRTCGLVGMTRGGPALRQSPRAKAGELLRYNLAVPLQVAPRVAGLFLGMELVGGMALDFAAGAEVVLFDDLDNISADAATPVTYNHEQEHPISGEPIVVQKFPMVGGFVPFGARLDDGRPHPHAGTGFGVAYTQGFPLRLAEDGGAFDGRWAHEPDVFRAYELAQLTYDGDSLKITRSDVLGLRELLPGWTLLNRGLCGAIPDGEDLLLPFQGGGPWLDERVFSPSECGMVRWRHGEAGWRPASFTPVTAGFYGFEPSVVRDTDGSLLMTARQRGPEILEKFDVWVWRSRDGGETWERVIYARKVRSESPVTINMTTDGAPFIAGNFLTTALNGRILGYTRDILALWPLNEARDALLDPLFARCGNFEWGPPPVKAWSIDHPVSANVRLADGQWHTVMGYRGMCSAETSSTLPPTPHTGCYVDEVLCAGPPVVASWRFDDTA